MYACNQSSQRNHGEEVILKMRAFFCPLRPTVCVVCFVEVWQWYFVFQRVYASLGQIKVQMVEILTKDVRPVGSLDHVADVRRPVNVLALDEHLARHRRRDCAPPEVQVSGIGFKVCGLEQQNLHIL